MNPSPIASEHSSAWRWLYKAGGVAALLAVVVAVSEIAITFFPGGDATAETVFEWFALFQESAFMGMRNMGLLNIFLTALGIPVFLALYAMHRDTQQQPLVALAMGFSFIGSAVFFATNRTFAMWDLSRQYAAATDEAQRALVAAAGQALLSVGGSHTPGTFLAFFLAEGAGLLISVAMLRGTLFSKVGAYAGLVGFGFLLLFEILSSFVPAAEAVTLLLAMVGGIANLVWYVSLGRRLWQLGQGGGTV